MSSSSSIEQTDNNNNNNTNREIRDKELKTNCENYKRIIFTNCHNIEAAETTVIDTIRSWAKDLEELFMLHDQAWLIPTIANIIMRQLKTIGVPESKFNYVHEALSVYKSKYIKHVDHSTVQQQQQSSSNLDNLQEQFIYHQRAKEYYAILDRLSKFQPTEVLRHDAQNIGEQLITIKERAIQQLEFHKIPVCEVTPKDFEGIEDKFQEKVKYRETIPATTELSQEMIGWGNDLIDVGKIIEEEGIIDKETGKTMLTDYEIKMIARAIQLERFLLKPTKDKKWKRDWLHWIDTISDSVQWFKHFSSTKNKKMDFKGFYRGLTREQIGARRESTLAVAKKIYELTPWKLYFSGIWWSKVRIPSGVDLSTRLSPKLSDRSIK